MQEVAAVPLPLDLQINLGGPSPCDDLCLPEYGPGAARIGTLLDNWGSPGYHESGRFVLSRAAFGQ